LKEMIEKGGLGWGGKKKRTQKKKKGGMNNAKPLGNKDFDPTTGLSAYWGGVPGNGRGRNYAQQKRTLVENNVNGMGTACKKG